MVYLNRRELRELVWQINLADDFIVVHGQHFAAFLHARATFIPAGTTSRTHVSQRHDDPQKRNDKSGE